MYICIHACVYIDVCIYIYIYIYIYIHTHTHCFVPIRPTRIFPVGSSRSEYSFVVIICVLLVWFLVVVVFLKLVYTSRFVRVILAQGPC